MHATTLYALPTLGGYATVRPAIALPPDEDDEAYPVLLDAAGVAHIVAQLDADEGDPALYYRPGTTNLVVHLAPGFPPVDVERETVHGVDVWDLGTVGLEWQAADDVHALTLPHGHAVVSAAARRDLGSTGRPSVLVDAHGLHSLAAQLSAPGAPVILDWSTAPAAGPAGAE